MICIINGMRHPEHYFWNCLHCIATQEQIKRIMDGNKVIIDGTEYQISQEQKI